MSAWRRTKVVSRFFSGELAPERSAKGECQPVEGRGTAPIIHQRSHQTVRCTRHAGSPQPRSISAMKVRAPRRRRSSEAPMPRVKMASIGPIAGSGGGGDRKLPACAVATRSARPGAMRLMIAAHVGACDQQHPPYWVREPVVGDEIFHSFHHRRRPRRIFHSGWSGKDRLAIVVAQLQRRRSAASASELASARTIRLQAGYERRGCREALRKQLSRAKERSCADKACLRRP